MVHRPSTRSRQFGEALDELRAEATDLDATTSKFDLHSCTRVMCILCIKCKYVLRLC